VSDWASQPKSMKMAKIAKIGKIFFIISTTSIHSFMYVEELIYNVLESCQYMLENIA